MSEPSYRCLVCERVVYVDRFARGFPPDAAKRKLAKKCRAAGCRCEPQYRAGLGFTAPQGMGTSPPPPGDVAGAGQR